MSKAPRRRAREGKISYFAQAEGPTLFGACEAAHPRWLAFIGCCTLAGLRWGEAAALEREDIEFKAAVIHLQRTISDKTGKVKVCKDGEDRFVPLSPRLAIWRRRHLEAVDLDGQLGEWAPEARALVFPNTRGHIGGHSTFMEHVWQPLLKSVKLKYRKPHSMRQGSGVSLRLGVHAWALLHPTRPRGQRGPGAITDPGSKFFGKIPRPSPTPRGDPVLLRKKRMNEQSGPRLLATSWPR